MQFIGGYTLRSIDIAQGECSGWSPSTFKIEIEQSVTLIEQASNQIK